MNALTRAVSMIRNSKTPEQLTVATRYAERASKSVGADKMLDSLDYSVSLKKVELEKNE